MVNIKINGAEIRAEDGATILEAGRKAGIEIPTLCFLKDVHEIGACRVCVVDVEGIERLLPACVTVCQEGMSVRTNTSRVRETRRANVELLLSQHRINCPVCERNGSCQLQKVASVYVAGDEEETDYRHKYLHLEWENNVPVIRDESKCIKCYRCVSVCDKIQSLGIWDMIGNGSHTSVGVSAHRKISEADCSYCGQCITHCPVNALHTADDTKKITGINGVLNDPEKTVIVQVAPAVRAAWGEEFGLPPEMATEKRMAAALRRLGFDYVFDTNFSADLTIMEEANEFLIRMKDRDKYSWPMFTSCCPGWVRFLKSQYPDMTGNLSTAKSPQQMFGAVAKSYFADKIGISPENIVCVSVMPCTAKKAELNIPNINDAAEGCSDVDISLTTREFCRMLKAENIDVSMLPEEEFDSPLGTGTGAAVIFGTTGGVMEAALRTAYFALTGSNPDADRTFEAVRAAGSEKPWVDAEYDLPGAKVRVAVVNGLGNARRLIRAIRRGEAEYDFVEVMACPGGCVGGGGQPIHYNTEPAAERSRILYSIDSKNALRCSHDNPDIKILYDEYLGQPCGERSHHLLHTDHFGWNTPKALIYDEDMKI